MVAHRLGMSQWVVGYIVRHTGLYHYHNTFMKVYKEKDPMRRLVLYTFLLNADMEDPLVLLKFFVNQ